MSLASELLESIDEIEYADELDQDTIDSLEQLGDYLCDIKGCDVTLDYSVNGNIIDVTATPSIVNADEIDMDRIADIFQVDKSDICLNDDCSLRIVDNAVECYETDEGLIFEGTNCDWVLEKGKIDDLTVEMVEASKKDFALAKKYGKSLVKKKKAMKDKAGKKFKIIIKDGKLIKKRKSAKELKRDKKAGQRLKKLAGKIQKVKAKNAKKADAKMAAKFKM